MAHGKISGFRLLLYLIYALLLTCALLIVRFPKAKFLKYAEKKVEASFPESRVNLSSLSYAFPFSVQLARAQMSRLESDEDILLLQDLKFTPKLSGVGLACNVTGAVLGGSFTSELKLAPMDKRYSFNDLEMNGLDLSRSAYLARILRRDVQGILKFKGEYSGSFDSSVDREKAIAGKGVMEIEGGSFTLRQPVLTLTTMEFQKLEAAVAMQDGVLTLSEGVIEGTEVKTDFSGTMSATANPESWKLDLKGAMVPSREFLQDKPQLARVVNRLQQQYRKNALPYTIGGTVANPRFRFGGNN